MKFVLSTQELNYLINKIHNVVGQKTAIPILSNFLLEAYNNELVLTATDLSVGIRCSVEAKILEEGATTLPAKKLSQLTREITAPQVELSSNINDITTIIAGTSRFKLNGMNKSEFPSLPDISTAQQFHMQQRDLKDMLYRTSFAVSKEDNRYALTGVCLSIANGKATFIGTDGKRLARTSIAVDADNDFTAQAIIPLKAVEEIAKTLLDEGEVKVAVMTDKIFVEANDTRIIAKLLSGEYPDVTRVIPNHSEAIIALHRDELLSMLRQVSLFAAENQQSVRFAFNDGELKLTANTMDIGEGQVSMPINYHGAPLEIAFNPGFFIDILRHCKEETITLGLTDAYNPGIITDSMVTEDLSNASPLFIIMPMRLSEE